MLVFTGCTPVQNNPQNDEQNDNKDVVQKASLQLSLEEYPRMDGSTANLPMMAEIMSRVCGITLQEAEELTTCTKTSQAWSSVANGNADILLVYEAAEDTKEYLETVGTELEVTPVGRDALVFINNEQNPVDNLTQAQLIDIYTGKVTNWNEVGGEELDIIPYQRVATSGSQSLFMKLLMKDVVPMDAPMELRPAEMGMLIDELARYNNEGNALGYSVFYYASYMYQQPGLRMIAVDGVQPSDDTIADGSYPLLNEYYVVIRADEPEDSPARLLRDWILSDEGRAAIIDAGYIPMPKE
ncbi:MAG: substrate-binding domain-containing protein [Peptococcaceae bacterium]|nr:substrate-binding domain-containing protein [Peptococcaceae bacterium]